MISCSDVYSLLLDELRVDSRGLSCEPDEFNRLIRLTNYEIYEDFIRKFEEDQSSSDDLGKLKVHNYSIGLTAGVGSLPSGYYRLIGKPRILDGTVYRNVDMVTTYEQACRDNDYLTQATTKHPTCTIGGVDGLGVMRIRVKPTTTTNVWIDYLRTLTVPFLDYMVNNTTLVPTFFADTTDVQSVPEGYTYRDGTAGGVAVTVSSISEDFGWNENVLSNLLTRLVNKIAKELPDELLIQTSTAEQAKEDAE